MKKNNEGYVMIYVLVVMVLLALVATGVLGVSLNNYKAQQAAGQQMQELYTVEGAAEQLVAELQNCSTGDVALTAEEIQAIDEELGDEAGEGVRAARLNNALLLKVFALYETEGLLVVQDRWNISPNALEIAVIHDEEGNIVYDSQMNPSYEINALIREGETQIEASLRLTMIRQWKDGETVEDDLLCISTYNVTYNSYEIKTGVAS